jgi:hypothetical protein
MDHLQLTRHEFAQQAAGSSASAATTDQAQVARFVNAMGDAVRGRVLDVACGPGIVTSELAAEAHEVVALRFDTRDVGAGERAMRQCWSGERAVQKNGWHRCRSGAHSSAANGRPRPGGGRPGCRHGSVSEQRGRSLFPYLASDRRKEDLIMHRRRLFIAISVIAFSSVAQPTCEKHLAFRCPSGRSSRCATPEA